MVLTNYPLSSFAVCADPNAGARAAAKEKHRQKMFNYKSDSVKYWNRETDFKNKKQFILGIGESRQLSDIRQAVEQKRAFGLSGKEKLARKYAATQYVNEGGGAKSAGRNKYLELLNAESKIDAGIAKFAGRGQGILLEKQRRLRASKLASNEKSVSVRPEFGAAVTMPGRDTGAMFMGALSTGLSIASLFVPGSDVRLKEDIEQVGVSPDGHKIYEFNYIGKPTRYRGAMAQDVVKIDPMAVAIRSDGYLGVHYNKIDVNMEVIS